MSGRPALPYRATGVPQRLCSFRPFSARTPAPRPRTADGTVKPITKLILAAACLLVAPLAGSLAAGQAPSPATLRGRVVDARSGAALPRVLVAVDGGPGVETGTDGRFRFEGLAAGPVRLYVSAVGYGLVQRLLELSPGEVRELEIPLSEGAATYTETVTVNPDRFRGPEAGVPSQHTLGAADLQNLRGVLADDALRAVQALPGVATGDDFRSEFSVRGSDFSHMNFTVDGFQTPFLMHMVRAVEERANTGSVAMINSDVLSEVTLQNGGYPQRTGNRTGADLSFTMREGSRERHLARASVSGTSASFTLEGPLGRQKRGSWLVSGRKSYLDLVINRLSDEGLSFGFADVQSKLRYDLSARQSVFATFLAGRSELREVPERGDETGLFVGANGSAIAVAGWRAAMGRALVSAAVMGAANGFANRTIGGIRTEEGGTDQLAARVDLAVNLRRVQWEAGAVVEHVDEAQRRQREISRTVTRVTTDFERGAARYGAYALLRLRPAAGVMIAPGVRADRSGLTSQTTGSPWVQAELALPRGVTVRAAGGLYQQFPDVEDVTGALAGDRLQPERALHTDLSVESRLSPATRVQMTLYNRRDDGMIRRPGFETRIVDGRLVRGAFDARYANAADGDARGVELLVQRSAPTALSGWLSYSYGRNRYTDRSTGERYWGDLDQRHTFNAYAFYRFSHRYSASAKLRTGSNFPIPGYYALADGRYYVSDRRNALRLPSYTRLDLRGNRTFDWSRRRLTLFVEVLNVLNRENVRFNPPRISSTTREVTRLFDSLVPVVPSAGVLVEF